MINIYSRNLISFGPEKKRKNIIHQEYNIFLESRLELSFNIEIFYWRKTYSQIFNTKNIPHSQLFRGSAYIV